LGHIDLLTALDHPVVIGSAETMTNGDVAVAAWICSRTYTDGIRGYLSGKAVKALHLLGLRWGAHDKEFDEQRDILLEYLETYMMAPPRWDPERESQPVIPWHLSVFAALQRDLNYTPAELWDMPLPRALELFAAVAANRGDDSLVTLKEQDVFEQMNNLEKPTSPAACSLQPED